MYSFLRGTVPIYIIYFIKIIRGQGKELECKSGFPAKKENLLFSSKISHCLHFVRSQKIRTFSIFFANFLFNLFRKKNAKCSRNRKYKYFAKKTKKIMRKFREKNAGIMRNNTKISRRNTGDLKYSFLNLLAHG